MAQRKFLKTVQLDDSDNQIYEIAATPGEWAVVGTFVFCDAELEKLSGKKRQAFAHGFLGAVSFGWSTLVVISEINDKEYDTVLQQLAQHLVARYGAPDIDTALPAAREEAEFVTSLCEHEVGTLLAIQRAFAGDDITENFKMIRTRSAAGHNNLPLWGLERA